MVFLSLSCLALAVVAAAAETPLEKAGKLLSTGKYAEAIDIYRPLAGKEPAAALGVARALEANGKTDEAVGALKPLAPKRAELEAELARLAFERGELKEAQARVEAALTLDDQQLLARWTGAELDRTAGRLEKADRGYHWLVEYYNNHEVKRAESLRWIGLAAAQFARWNRLSDQFETIVNDVYPDALKLDPAYWPAHFEAGLLFMEKYNEADAAREFQAALEINPQAAEVHAALAAVQLENHQVDQAEASLRRALEINPRLLCGWQVKADLAWLNLELPQTLQLLEEKVLPLNPVDEETLGRIAACYALLDGPPRQAGAGGSRLERLVGEVTRRNPHAGEFFYTVALMLEDRNKQAEAEHYFQEAIRVMPRQVGPQAGLGLLYMRMGREEEARKLLAEAFESDPFHVRVKNMLDVLDVLDGLKVARSEHFVVSYDDKVDQRLGRYATRQMEQVYPELCTLFGYQPPGRPRVEIFNAAQGMDGHEWFSARMTGLPYLDTVAACTGRVVAMASPNQPAARQFNWARVLKHELSHVITLQQTKFNIPHWFTEGLAVWCEGYPRPQSWNEMLVDRMARGKVFNLQTLNSGFARPGSGEECQLAYCQAELYVEYMLSLRGPDSLRKMLAAYADNVATAAAIRQVFGLSQAEFERGYGAYVGRLTAGLSAMKRPLRRSFAELQKARRDRPKDADAAAELAYAHLARGASHEALDLARKALELRPKHPLASYVAARLRLADGKEDEAVAMLEGSLDRRAPETLSLELLAELRLKAKKYDGAAELFALAERLEPTNPAWPAALAQVYLAAEKPRAMSDALTRLVRIDSDELAPRKKLAAIALEKKDYAAAARWAKQGIEIDVNDGGVHRLLAEALAGCKKYDSAIEEYEVAVEIKPSQAEARFGLAQAYAQVHQAAKARETLEALLKIAPDHAGAKALLESLKAP